MCQKEMRLNIFHAASGNSSWKEEMDKRIVLEQENWPDVWSFAIYLQKVHGSAPGRHLVDVRSHLQILKRRVTWVSKDSSLSARHFRENYQIQFFNSMIYVEGPILKFKCKMKFLEPSTQLQSHSPDYFFEYQLVFARGLVSLLFLTITQRNDQCESWLIFMFTL